MNILVTGGLGFIGSNYIKYMLDKYPDCKIINLDKITYAGNPENLADLKNNPRYDFIKGDICDLELVKSIISKVDMVLNFAAESHVDNSIIEPTIFTKTNIEGTHTLLEAARQSNLKRFVHISTDEVYGSIVNGSFKETDLLQPNSPYSASKAGAEMIARAYNKTFGMDIVITRSSNNFGPYQHPEKLIPLFITNLMQNKKVPLYGTGKNIRDWIYVKDNCSGIDFVSQNGKGGEIYNIGGSNEKENIVITSLILKDMKKDNTWIQYVPDRLGHDFRYSLDCSKLKSLGWVPKTKFDDAILRTIEWYRNNETWWQKLKNN